MFIEDLFFCIDVVLSPESSMITEKRIQASVNAHLLSMIRWNLRTFEYSIDPGCDRKSDSDHNIQTTLMIRHAFNAGVCS